MYHKLDNKEWLRQKLRGMTVEDLAKELDISYVSIYRACKRNGLKLTPLKTYVSKVWLKNQLQTKSCSAIAQESGIGLTIIQNSAREHGLIPPKKAGARRHTNVRYPELHNDEWMEQNYRKGAKYMHQALGCTEGYAKKMIHRYKSSRCSDCYVKQAKYLLKHNKLPSKGCV